MDDKWMPRDKWDALVRGEGCPLCAAIESQEIVDAYGYTVADFPASRLRLGANQWVPGYCVLIARTHAREPYELNEDDQAQFFNEMMRAGQALERVFDSVKMNFELLGNAVPHLHCHIIPRYYGDPAPGRPIPPEGGTLLLDHEEYAQRARDIRQALGMG